MFRFVWAAVAIVLFTLAQSISAQSVPEFQWVKQVDNSGLDSVAGLGVDAAGNTYIAGSTSSAIFPVQSAAQRTFASSGLYRITGTGSAYLPLGLGSASFVAIDPQNPSTIYVVSNGALLRSTNNGSSFTPLVMPSGYFWTVAINPSNDQILYAGTLDQGLFKSTNGGASWSPSNGSLQPVEPGEFEFQSVWIDPNHPGVLFTYAIGNFYRSADAGNTWQMIIYDQYVLTLNFDVAVPGLIYIVNNQGMASVSTDDGQTFTSLAHAPNQLGAILPDPSQPGRLIGYTSTGLDLSTDNGSTWSVAVSFLSNANYSVYAADWQSGFLYFSSSQVVRVSTDLKTVSPVGPPSTGTISSIAAANGIAYVADGGSRDVYVTKLDPSGNIVYSTYFGGSNDDVAQAVAVDSSGNVYVTGTTTSLDFPTTKGAYATSGPSFLFKLNPDGSVAYSTYGAAGTNPQTLSIDPTGAAYLGGTTGGGLTTTSGAYETTCQYCGFSSNGFFGVFTNSGFACKFDPTGSTLVYSTYVGGQLELYGNIITTIAAASDGSLYLGGITGLFHLNSPGSALLASVSPPSFMAQAIAIAPDGSLYAGGSATTFTTTAGAYQPTYAALPSLPGQASNLPAEVIARWDSQLANVLEATFFGPGKSISAIAFDSSGNVYLGGGTAQQGLPTRTPIQLGFAAETGFLSELSGDLSTLIFSGYFGDTQDFSVAGIGVEKGGTVALGGLTGIPNSANSGPRNPWVNSVSLAPPPALRVDSVVSAASLLDGPISPAETVIVEGAGFGSNPQLSIAGTTVPAISASSTSITATVPSLTPDWAEVQVTSGGYSSNQVLVPVNSTAPAIFSQNGSGVGQGYILNKNGTLNTPSNPAAPGDPISVFATGVGPITVDQGYAVTQYPVDVYVDGLFANGIEAFLAPVSGLPGNVYEIQVYVPNPVNLVAANPNLQNFTFPPLVPLTMTINGVVSQIGITISISQ